MTILSKNIKTIRKHLGYTQIVMAEILNIGFRTFVRYEAGERDAPISTLVQIAQLGKLSLDRFITTELTKDDFNISDLDRAPTKLKKLEVIGGGLEEGRLMFKGFKKDFIVCFSAKEKNLLSQFRSLGRSGKDRTLKAMEKVLKESRGGKGDPSSKTVKKKQLARLKRIAKSTTQTTHKR